MNKRMVLLPAWLWLLSLPALAEEVARTPSSDGASVGFANLADGDVVPPSFQVKFSISGMGVAPAGAEIENTGHHHLLIDTPELPPLDQPLPVTEHILDFREGQFQAELRLPEGNHSLQLLFADHDHVPHEPPVMSEVIAIMVSADAPPMTDAEE